MAFPTFDMTTTTPLPITVLGAGSWGITLAWLAHLGGHSVTLWDRKPEKIQQFQANRSITFPVTVDLPQPIQLTANLANAVADAAIVILAVTSSGTRPVLEQLQANGLLHPNVILVNASKGIEYPSLKTLSDVITELCPDNPQAVLAGPTLAPEILQGLPTAATIATDSKELGLFLQQQLSTERFRLYTNQDVVGTEMGGALKNVFAIVSGYMNARQMGDNAISTLITRGLAEMTRFCVASGADVQTLYGLSGLGDLLATCNSPLSRNYQVGYRMAKGDSLETILTSLGMVAEGVKTTAAVCELSQKLGIDMPVVQLVKRAFDGDFTEEAMIHTLMSRRLKAEAVGG